LFSLIWEIRLETSLTPHHQVEVVFIDKVQVLPAVISKHWQARKYSEHVRYVLVTFVVLAFLTFWNTYLASVIPQRSAILHTTYPLPDVSSVYKNLGNRILLNPVNSCHVIKVENHEGGRPWLR